MFNASLMGAEMLLRYFMRSAIAFFMLLGPALAQGETSALDDSTEPLKSCEWTTISSVMEGIQLVNWSSGSRICELATNSLGRPIPIAAHDSSAKRGRSRRCRIRTSAPSTMCGVTRGSTTS